MSWISFWGRGLGGVDLRGGLFYVRFMGVVLDLARVFRGYFLCIIYHNWMTAGDGFMVFWKQATVYMMIAWGVFTCG